VLKTGMGLKRQVVELGKTNANFVVVVKGIAEGEVFLMAKPEAIESISWN
jgi:hypothetical protein